MMRMNFLFLGLVLVCFCLFSTINACKWAYLAAQGINPHGQFSEDDLGKFENIQAFEDFYSGGNHEHVPYHKPNPQEMFPLKPDL